MTAGEVDVILSKFNTQRCTKGERLFTAGQTCKKLHFIVSGVIRSFIATDENKIKVIMFGFPDWWITDIDSFLNESKSVVTIDALEDSVLLSLSKTDFDDLIRTSQAFESAFRIMMQKSYVREQRRSFELIAHSSKERYLSLIGRFPDIEQQVSQKNIASYIGISPEFLSSLRRELKNSPVQS